MVRYRLNFNGEGLLASRPSPKLQDYPTSAIRGCLSNTFVASLQIWRTSPSAVNGRAMSGDTDPSSKIFKAGITLSFEN